MLIAGVTLDFMRGLGKQWRNLLKQGARLQELDRPASSLPLYYMYVYVYIYICVCCVL